MPCCIPNQRLLRQAEMDLQEDRLMWCQSCGHSAEEGSKYCMPCGTYWADVDAGLFADDEWEEREEDLRASQKGSRDDFSTIASQLKKLKGDFILSINDVPEIRALFAWAEILPVQTTYSVAAGPSTKAPELIITSLDAAWVKRQLKE